MGGNCVFELWNTGQAADPALCASLQVHKRDPDNFHAERLVLEASTCEEKIQWMDVVQQVHDNYNASSASGRISYSSLCEAMGLGRESRRGSAESGSLVSSEIRSTFTSQRSGMTADDFIRTIDNVRKSGDILDEEDTLTLAACDVLQKKRKKDEWRHLSLAAVASMRF